MLTLKSMDTLTKPLIIQTNLSIRTVNTRTKSTDSGSEDRMAEFGRHKYLYSGHIAEFIWRSLHKDED